MGCKVIASSQSCLRLCTCDAVVFLEMRIIMCERKCVDVRSSMSGPEVDKKCVGKDGKE